MKEKKRPGRKRRAAGWTLLTLGVLAAGMWFGSGWWEFGWGGSAGTVRCASGCFVLQRSTYWAASPGWSGSLSHSSGWAWWLAPKRRVHKEYSAWYDPAAERERQLGFVYVMVYGPMPTGDVPIRIEVLLWPIPLLLWTPAALLLRSGIRARRRAITNTCLICGYSLAGLAAGALCPECGKEEATHA